MGNQASLLRQQEAAYEALLAQEGLAPIDERRAVVLEQGARGRTRPRHEEDGEAVQAFTAWALKVLETCAFHDRGPGLPSTLTRRKVWRLYAGGRSLNQIAAEVGISRQKVVVAVQVTKRESGVPCPVSNPWLRRRYDVEEPMQQAKRVEYAAIHLRNEMTVPGVPIAKNRLMPMKGHDGLVRPLMGMPGPGGIEVEFHVTLNGRKATQLVTVPWWNIKQADQVAEDWIG